MALKYRVRLKNERVVGPFEASEIGELYLKGHIKGTEMCQLFPIGDWKDIHTFQELNQIIKTLQLQKEKDVAEGKVSNHTSPSIAFQEFQFEKRHNNFVDYDELEKKYKEDNPHVEIEEPDLERTVIVRPKVAAPVDLDKTVVIPRQELSEIKKPVVPEPKVTKEPVRAIVELRQETEEEQNPKRLANDATQFMNLAQALPKINAQLSVNEQEFEKKLKFEEAQEKKRLKDLQEAMMIEEALEEGNEEEEIEVVQTYDKKKKVFTPEIKITKKKKNMSIVAALAFAGVFYFFLQEEEKVEFKGPLFLEVKFPVTNQMENIQVANQDLIEARKSYAEGTYYKKAIATGLYLNSLQNKFSNNESMGEQILTYAELLENSKDSYKATAELYKYIQIAESKLLIDANAATGAALFYSKIGKHDTGVQLIKNFLRAGNKAPPKMLSYYLRLLVGAGDFIEAKKTATVIENIPKKPIEAYVELANYYIAESKIAETRKFVNEGLKYYPNSVPILLMYSDILLQDQAIKKFEEVLAKIDSLNGESSPYYLAKLYKNLGYLNAYKDQNEEAAKYFKRSLDLHESDDLRFTLSQLEIGGDSVAQTLILESKVINLLKKAQAEYKNKNTETAFQFMIEAIDAYPDYVPAVLFHAELNMNRGFFDAAINSLTNMINKNPKDEGLKEALITAYIKAYKFEEAERMLGEIAQTRYATTPEFASLMGQFSEAKRLGVLALTWYNRALARNPLRDEDMYRVASILVRGKKFNEARKGLMAAIALDPKNVRYHALYSEILYEQDSTDTAIGYLRDIIDANGEDPLLVATITGFYFKSGKLKEFQAYYKKYQEMPKKDVAIYDVLMASAKLEGREDEFITYARESLKLNPGNLKIRMELGEIFYRNGQYDMAIIEFNEVKNLLISYPNVHYYLALVYLAKDDIEKAREMAEQELKLNPTLDTAFYIMGEVERSTRNYREAILRYEKAISLNPRSIDALLSMAQIRLAQNYSSQALDLLSRALKEDVSNPNIHKMMGDAYRASGQRALAKEKYEDYLKLNPVAKDKATIESIISSLR